MLHLLFDSAGDDQPPREPELDIIAVHGLNFKNSERHAWKTWTKADKLWLRDFLPKALSRPSRVMLFEYNSSPAVGASSMRLSDHANNLLQWLKLKRKDAAERPLAFICHSLGGLVVKEALVTATLDTTYRFIVESTRLLIFFATPHQGGNFASIGDVIAKIARAGLAGLRNDLLDALKRDSAQATTRSEQSRSLYDGIQVVSFFEGGSFGKTGTIVDKKSATLNLSGRHEKQIGIDADHSSICKFDSHDSHCELVLGTINIEVEEALKSGTHVEHYIPSYPLDDSIAPVKVFVQRPDLLQSIRDQFVRPLDVNQQGQVRKVGVWGMGGAGKSQLARSYLSHYRKEYQASFWIRGDQPTTVDRDFLAIYHQLPKIHFSSIELDPEDVKREVLLWFTRNNGRFLFIFDGADYLDEKDKHYVALRQYFPRSPNVHIVITSRSRIAQRMSTFNGVLVSELKEPQSVELFLRCAEIEPSQDATDEAGRIVKELGNLALAVSMAGSYISQTPRLSSNLRAYLDDFRRQREVLLSKMPDENEMNYSHSVMAVWETSYDAVSERSPDACRLLTLLSFIHYEDVFPELFGFNNDLDATEVPSWTSLLGFQNRMDNISYLEDCFQILQKYSLCHYEMGRVSYSVHRLVHAWGYDRLQGQKAYQFWLAASQLLRNNIEAMSYSSTEPTLKLRIASHVAENLKIFTKLSDFDTKIPSLDTVESFFFFFDDIGRWQEAELAESEVLEKRKRILGDEHPDTISAMGNLAITLGGQGKLDEAAQMQKEVLEKRKRILGDEHLDTISAMSNLAITLSKQGKLIQAAQMKKEVLEKRKRILGDEHPSTILAMGNLANTLGGQGKLDEAAQMQKEVLEKRKRVLGDEHLDTILAMSNLSTTLSKQGKLIQAAQMKKEVLEKMKRILGDEHPDTILAMSNLANTLSNQGKLDEAAQMFNEVLEKRKRILGDEHPDTISAMSNLAIPLSNQGKLDEAAQMFNEVLEKMKRILGDEHPDTISAMSNLAITLSDQGKLDEVTQMHKEVLEKRKRILGDEHPHTILAMNNLAITLSDQGKLDQAVQMKRRC
ncbi:hypothetical protein QQS21_003612 [Conoideocrella luteorostrata]|uniref:NB-ARC domain-containing protein n=1 Tax=Conoideocrella luteorostrata TaxID=1105319 RepID=A0AAJ0CT35_9HYPO|nr:hypothetical protein QQS21_003612 [Conoideocrella luteorostrata]